MTDTQITPRLIVRDVDEAIAFYRKTMGAELLERYEDRKRQLVVHAAIGIGASTVTLAQEHRDWGNDAPPSLGGSAVLLEVVTDDADALGAAMVARGAEVVFPIDDQFYGKREGRLRDPFGHLWMVSQVLEELSPAEIERRMENV